MNNPGIAAGVKNGRIQRISEILNWMGPKLTGAKAMVSTV